MVNSMNNFNYNVSVEKNEKIFLFLFVCVVFVFTYVIYYESIFYGDSKFDDQVYLGYLRELFKDGVTSTALSSMLTDFVNANWHPVTILSMAIDFIIGGDNPIYFHVTNTIIHVFNVIMVFLIFSKLTENKLAVALTALLFAIHPLNVETVVWISERKGLLSTLFALNSLYFYILYKKENVLRYKIISVLLFTLSLLSKPTTVTIPVIFMLLDITVFNENSKINIKLILYSLKDKAPYFLVGLGIIILSFIAQSDKGALSDLSMVSPLLRIETSINNLFIYLSKVFVPVNLSSFYPHINKPVFITFLYAIIILSWGVLAVKYFSKSKLVTFCVFFFFIQIIPLSGLFQTGSHSAANRYTYLPAIGMFFLLSFYMSKIPNRLIYFSSVSFLILTLTILSHNHVKVWNNNLDLWENNAKVTEKNYYTAYYYSVFLIENNKIDEASRYFYNVIGNENKYFANKAIEDISTILIEHKHYLDAKVILEKAIKHGFIHKGIYRQLALLDYFHFNNKVVAQQHIEKILSIEPLDFRVNRIYLKILLDQKKYNEALLILNKLNDNKKNIDGDREDIQSMIDENINIILENRNN